MFELRCDGKVFDGSNLPGFEIEAGINIEASRIFEELAETAQHSAFTLVVKAFIEYLGQLRGADGQTDGTISIAGQIPCQTMEPAGILDQHGPTQIGERI